MEDEIQEIPEELLEFESEFTEDKSEVQKDEDQPLESTSKLSRTRRDVSVNAVSPQIEVAKGMRYVFNSRNNRRYNLIVTNISRLTAVVHVYHLTQNRLIGRATLKPNQSSGFLGNMTDKGIRVYNRSRNSNALINATLYDQPITVDN